MHTYIQICMLIPHIPSNYIIAKFIFTLYINNKNMKAIITASSNLTQLPDLHIIHDHIIHTI